MLLLQAPPIPDRLTDQGLLLVAFMLAIGVGGVGALLRWGPDAWIKVKSANGGHAKLDQALLALAEIRVQLTALSARVDGLTVDCARQGAKRRPKPRGGGGANP